MKQLRGASITNKKKANLTMVNEWKATIADKLYTQTEGHQFRSQSHFGNAVQLKDRSRYGI